MSTATSAGRTGGSTRALLGGCAFFSVLLITAYAGTMRSPTILTVSLCLRAGIPENR